MKTEPIKLPVSPFSGGISPKAYADYAAKLDALVMEGRALGLFRTAAVVHCALREARAETPEAMPRRTAVIDIPFGPVSTQDRYKT